MDDKLIPSCCGTQMVFSYDSYFFICPKCRNKDLFAFYYYSANKR